MWIALHGYDGRIPVQAYISVILQRIFRDHCRAVRRRRTPLRPPDDCYKDDAMLRIDVPALMERLTPGQRKALVELSCGSQRRTGPPAERAKAKYRCSKANVILLREARKVFSDYRPADQGALG